MRESSESLRVRCFENGLNLEAVEEKEDDLGKLHKLEVEAIEDVADGAGPADGRSPDGHLELAGENWDK